MTFILYLFAAGSRVTAVAHSRQSAFARARVPGPAGIDKSMEMSSRRGAYAVGKRIATVVLDVELHERLLALAQGSGRPDHEAKRCLVEGTFRPPRSFAHSGAG
jgi:hypothetical protein